MTIVNFNKAINSDKSLLHGFSKAYYFSLVHQAHIHFTIPYGFNSTDLNHKANLLLNNR